MTPKHSLPRSPSSEPSRKRQHTGSSHSPSSSCLSLSRPTTPYPARPFDSPSNPFGRTRAWNLIQDLPPPTSFAKHLPLRFQYVRRGVARETLEGVYRVVQVPQSYTLVHVKCLIAFLFGGAYGQGAPHTEKGKVGPAYMFELMKNMVVYSSVFRPGQIKYGTTWAYASSVLNPYLYCPDWESEDGDEPASRNTPEPEIREEQVEDERKWMAEEDVTVAHVWPEGGDSSRGMIYQHDANLQVHVTINTMPIKSRRGKDNLPHVFSACGLVYIDEPDEDDDLEEEDQTASLDPSNWNEPKDKFARYYNKNTILPFPTYGGEANSSSTSLDLTFSSSSPRHASSSSLPSLPSPHFSRQGHFSESSPRVCVARTGSSPLRRPKHTPAPRPSQRKRILHLQRRIGALTRVRAEDEPRKRVMRKSERHPAASPEM
ncbi:hypothetical protein GGX14DRAFT_699416 [Mycena pura]|uniref:Uncharacterized protein n=1 Tax=Mycena pura TaxID=153505 RepID=A0AAD6V7K5_9AGAR|nr:hypothetical protein GGX14DRAFT_699416 [Mycena pura]